MDTPLNFTLRYDDGTNDQGDHTGDVAAVGTFGTMWFEPNVIDGYRIPTTDGGLTPRAFLCVMENGVLKTAIGGSADVRLWGNDPNWGIDRYSYRVRADLTDATGVAVQWEPFEFDAPGIDQVRYLKEFIPRPGQKFGRGPGAPGLSSGEWNGDGELILENADGSTLSPIVAPSPGIVMFIDNGDGTLSAATG